MNKVGDAFVLCRDKLPESTGDKLPESTGDKLPDSTGDKLPESTRDKLPDSTGDKLPESTGHKLPESTREDDSTLLGETFETALGKWLQWGVCIPPGNNLILRLSGMLAEEYLYTLLENIEIFWGYPTSLGLTVA